MNESKAGKRIINALQNGWVFGSLHKTPQKTSRHSLVASDPNDPECRSPDGGIRYRGHKVDGREEDWLNSLLDEAGVPE